MRKMRFSTHGNLKIYERKMHFSASSNLKKCVSADAVVQKYMKEKCISAHASWGSLKINEGKTHTRIGNLEL